MIVLRKFSLFFWLDPKEPKSQACKNNFSKQRNILVIYPNSQTQFTCPLQDARLLSSNKGAFPSFILVLVKSFLRAIKVNYKNQVYLLSITLNNF